MVKRVKRFIAAIAFFALIAGVAIPSIGKSYAETINYHANRYQESYDLGKYSSSKKQLLRAKGTLDASNPRVGTGLKNTGTTDAVGSVSIIVHPYNSSYVAYQKGSGDRTLLSGGSIYIDILRHPDDASMSYEHKGVMRNETTTINVSQRKDIVNY